MSLIAEYTIDGEEFINLQKELSNFYNIQNIPFFNPFDVQSRKKNIPVIIPRVDVSYGDMTVNIIDKHNLKVFPEIILRNVTDFTKNDNYKIINCWASDMKKGSEGLLHHHLPTQISGVYYHKIDPSDSHIEFMIDEEITSYESKVGKMYIWPAYMLHRIPLKTTDTDRRSLSFNLIWKE